MGFFDSIRSFIVNRILNRLRPQTPRAVQPIVQTTITPETAKAVNIEPPVSPQAGTPATIVSTRYAPERAVPQDAINVGVKPVLVTGGTPEQQLVIERQPSIVINLPTMDRGELLLDGSPAPSLAKWLESMISIDDNCSFAEFREETNRVRLRPLSVRDYRHTQLLSDCHFWWTKGKQ